MFSNNKLYQNFITPEKNGKKVGIFRTICAIFGGLIVSYLGMTLLAFLIPTIAEESIIVPLVFNTFAWACVAFWISLSPSKLSAFLCCVIPTFVFSILIYFFFKA